MTTQRKVEFLMLPFQSYSVLSLLGLLACRVAYGHADDRLLIMFLSWSSIIASFMWLLGAAVQAHFRFIQRACLNAVLAIVSGIFGGVFDAVFSEDITPRLYRQT